MADEVQVLVGLGLAALALCGLWVVLRIWEASGVTFVEVETPVDRQREIVAWCTGCGSWNFVTLRPGDGVGDDFTTPEGWRLAEAGNGDRAAWCPMCVPTGKVSRGG